VGGALVESDVPLEPESEAVLELVGGTRHDIVPFRVVRCHSSVVESRLIYWGACAFTQPLELNELLQPPAVDGTPSTIDHSDRFDIAVRTTVERFVSLTDGEAGSVRSLRASQVTELVTALQEVSHSQSFDSVGEAIRYLLAVVTAALQRGDDDHAITFRLIEERLHAALPWLTARFAAAPTSSTAVDKEALYFKLPTAGGGGPSVLNVELSKGSIFEDWQFRLLKTSMYLAALLRPLSDGGASPPIEGRERRRHVRVRGRFDGRRLGAISMALAIRDLSLEGCFVDSLNDEESGRQFTMEVLLPDEGRITVRAEVVCNRPGFGFAVRFIETSEDARSRLARAVAARTGTVVNSGGATNVIGESADCQCALSTFA
jgi:PilZ domain